MKRSHLIACLSCAALVGRSSRALAKPEFSDTLVQCSEIELTPEQMAISAQNAVAINPSNAPGPGRERLLANYKKFWGVQGVELSVGFVDATPADLRKKILVYMNKWRPATCSVAPTVSFRETNDVASADIRIYLGPSTLGMYWSFVGTDSRKLRGAEGQTMNLDGFTMATPDSEFDRLVCHEAGHALGFEHEHRRKEIVDYIIPAKAYEAYKKSDNWDKAKVDAQILTPFVEDPDSYIGSAQVDSNSIMCYTINQDLLKPGAPTIGGGTKITQADLTIAGQIYPVGSPHVGFTIRNAKTPQKGIVVGPDSDDGNMRYQVIPIFLQIPPPTFPLSAFPSSPWIWKITYDPTVKSRDPILFPGGNIAGFKIQNYRWDTFMVSGSKFFDHNVNSQNDGNAPYCRWSIEPYRLADKIFYRIRDLAYGKYLWGDDEFVHQDAFPTESFKQPRFLWSLDNLEPKSACVTG